MVWLLDDFYVSAVLILSEFWDPLISSSMAGHSTNFQFYDYTNTLGSGFGQSKQSVKRGNYKCLQAEAVSKLSKPHLEKHHWDHQILFGKELKKGMLIIFWKHEQLLRQIGFKSIDGKNTWNCLQV